MMTLINVIKRLVCFGGNVVLINNNNTVFVKDILIKSRHSFGRIIVLGSYKETKTSIQIKKRYLMIDTKILII